MPKKSSHLFNARSKVTPTPAAKASDSGSEPPEGAKGQTPEATPPVSDTGLDETPGSSPLPGDKAPVAPTNVAPWLVAPEWQSRGLFLAFPCYKDTNPATAWTLCAMMSDLGRDKFQMDIRMGDAMIYHARNKLVEAFLKTEAQWLLFLDDDMVTPVGRPGWMKTVCRLPDNYPDEPLALHTAHRLTSHNRSIVGATYFYRYPNSLAVNSLAKDRTYIGASAGFEDRLMEAEWTGTGCMLIKRQVFLDLMKEYPNLKGATPDLPFNWFHPGEGGEGEDVMFCRRAGEIGHQTFVDCRLHAQHVGRACYGLHTSPFNKA